MSKIQDVFNRIQETKKEQKKIRDMYNDALSNNGEYQKLVGELKSIRDRKKQIEDGIKDDFSSEISKMETLKLDIENDSMILSDLALEKIVKGENLEVIDQKNNKYEPVFTVKFKKS